MGQRLKEQSILHYQPCTVNIVCYTRISFCMCDPGMKTDLHTRVRCTIACVVCSERDSDKEGMRERVR